MGHDPVLDKDVARGIETLLDLPGIDGNQICVVSHTRGGYMTLKALVTHNKQNEGVRCYVSSYPTWQDPNAPEPMQVYQYAPEVNDLNCAGAGISRRARAVPASATDFGRGE